MAERMRTSEGEIVALTRAGYDHLGNRAAFDAHLHPDITIWESDQSGGLMRLDGLNALRDRRATDESTQRPMIEVVDPVVDSWGDAAVIRYVLHAVQGDVEAFHRVTNVLTKDESGWRVVHHHAEHLVSADAV